MSISDDDRDGFGEMALMVRSFQLSKMLQVAAALQLADRVAEGPCPVTRLASECDADAGMLLRLCRALAAFGVFSVDDEEQVSQTARSAWLRQGATPTLHHAAMFWTSPHQWKAWAELEHTVRTGECAAEAVFGMPGFEYLRTNPGEAKLFDLLMQHSPDDRHAAVVAAYDFSASLVVDVGGGNGALLAAILGELQRRPRRLVRPGGRGGWRRRRARRDARRPLPDRSRRLLRVGHTWRRHLHPVADPARLG